ncbi:MAG: DNA gyrase subunit A [Candidatus Raymondbacteria bacterium RIFOXYA2_FULL_49_16]|uniref:DNA gyrase subunit A n=1 Tax=Candidatus Raymondbacteria bacterium RIFOXYD12_FULL_49_13 TaxID=1817890 RepID=A0A1F7FA66_UNCRA|nr:MAG: DNA gyrase subunit A [Candidatus Raymondbacteria bacterium RIFOXYA2_FULL_49_16]OGK03501.1 MAG: DNA gyrase subunit A [Candidatus Raymondbacteria bacterium RIFOXYD12_FULL_49_13]OGP42826.1 MAG: DNA gyrase subunit A [Candidatus Raymondbacteria bacterium RIFOXYB2_FULL_49_35]
MDTESRIIPTYIEDELKTSYLDYAMSVIIARALPDVRDGLKPVHRRVLYGMNQLGLHYNRAYKKSARIVGEVMGKYHPHGDSAIYDTLVRMAQEWSLRYMLVDGQGNFGSVDGDAPAAMRYTEARLARISEEMLRDLDKGTCDFRPNFDETETEPVVLPSAIPNLLVNGSTGIAVGMATNIPPHNIVEIVNAFIALVDNPDITIDELMQHVKGPDFPTAGLIIGRAGIAEAYRTGRGKLVMRAKSNIEKKQNGREAIIVTEIPYMVNKANLLEKIAELIKDKKVEGISDLRDESDRNGMRMVIELKKDAYAEVILNQLFKYTQLQSSFGIITLALVDNKPRVLNLKECLVEYLKHRHEVLIRRTRFDLDLSEKRAHILEGLKIALDNIDAVIETIKKSKDAETARINLMERFGLSIEQASAILEMRLQRLTGLEREKIENEYLELIKFIEELRFILENEPKRMEIIKQEARDVAERYGDERRTAILDAEGEFSIEDMIAEEDMVITISHQGYIKRLPINTYRKQGRGGKGITAMETKEEDFVEKLFVASTHSYILFFSNKGRCYWLKVHEIPQAGRTARGKAIINMVELKPDEKIRSLVPVRSFEDQYAQKSFIMFATKMGTINKQPLPSFSNPRRDGINAIKVDDNDEIVDVALTDGTANVVLGSKYGLAVHFNESNIRELGRNTRGVRGINLGKDDEVISMVVVRRDTTLLTVTEKGYGKRTPIGDYRVTNRGGKGIINLKITEKNGPVVSMCAVDDQNELMIISRNGIIIRISAADISNIGRATQGVRLINLGIDDKVIDVSRIIPETMADQAVEEVVSGLAENGTPLSVEKASPFNGEELPADNGEEAAEEEQEAAESEETGDNEGETAEEEPEDEA